MINLLDDLDEKAADELAEEIMAAGFDARKHQHPEKGNWCVWVISPGAMEMPCWNRGLWEAWFRRWCDTHMGHA